MKCFFFISILAVTLSSTVVDFPLQKFINNRQLFLSALANADKGALEKMIELVVDLIDEGEKERQSAIANHDAKKDAHDRDVKALNDAIEALRVASENFNVAVSNKDALVIKESQQRGIHLAALAALAAATQKHDTALSHMDDTVARVDTEAVMLGKVKVLLESVKSGSRRLLSITDADPGAVDAVIAKVNTLLDQGATEKSNSIAAEAQASVELEAANTAEVEAHDQHTATAGQLAAAWINVGTTKVIKIAKAGDKFWAAHNEKISSSQLATALGWKNSEISRIDTEKATLEEVHSILTNLL